MPRLIFHTLIGLLLTTNAWANLATTQGTAFTQGQFGPHTMDAVSIAGNLTSTGADITAGKDLNITAHDITLAAIQSANASGRQSGEWVIYLSLIHI